MLTICLGQAMYCSSMSSLRDCAVAATDIHQPTFNCLSWLVVRSIQAILSPEPKSTARPENRGLCLAPGRWWYYWSTFVVKCSNGSFSFRSKADVSRGINFITNRLCAQTSYLRRGDIARFQPQFWTKYMVYALSGLCHLVTIAWDEHILWHGPPAWAVELKTKLVVVCLTKSLTNCLTGVISNSNWLNN